MPGTEREIFVGSHLYVQSRKQTKNVTHNGRIEWWGLTKDHNVSEGSGK